MTATMRDVRFQPCPINHYIVDGSCVTCVLNGRT